MSEFAQQVISHVIEAIGFGLIATVVISKLLAIFGIMGFLKGLLVDRLDRKDIEEENNRRDQIGWWKE